ncbi:unnamed protein product [Chironomus riparius]|uniref:Ionotropic receptor n=1 Tax=Chironomus riparius TaxID=315576 RepID=A0A9N9S5X6_9DIPT|nr:unnamed protein product [Chironomus riparius]
MFFNSWIIFLPIVDGVLQPVTQNLEVLSVSKAINEIIDEFYVKNKIQFDVRVVREYSGLLNPIVDGLLAVIKDQNSYTLYASNPDMKTGFGLKSSAIFVAFSCSDYSLIHKVTQLWNYYPKNLKFLTFIQSCGLEYFNSNLKYITNTQRLSYESGSLDMFEFILINDQDILYLTTIEWFTESACNQPQLIILNKFNKTSQKWFKKLQNYEKFKNFHGCHLIMGIELDKNEGGCWDTAIIQFEDEIIIQLIGIGSEIFGYLSKIHNFESKFKLISNESIYNDVDVFLPIYRFEYIYIGHFHVTTMFAQAEDIIIATPGEMYTPYEKLLLPFDDTTWIMLNLTFLAAFVAILIINQMPKFIQKSIFGENVKTPTLNVVSTFFGISQTKVPTGHIPRAILIFFVFFCLIFRTCFQSKMFEFMTSEPRRPPPNSMQDLRDRNYTVYSNLLKGYIEDLIKDDEYEWPNVKEVSDSEFIRLFTTQSLNDSAKISLILNIGNIKDYIQDLHKSFKWHKIPNYKLQVSLTGFILAPNNFIFHILDDLIQKLMPAGIIDFMIDSCLTNSSKIVDSKQLSALSVDNLTFGFVIWFGFFLLCFPVFLLEIITWKVFEWIKQKPTDRVGNNVKLDSTDYQEVKKEIREFLAVIIQKVELDVKF